MKDTPLTQSLGIAGVVGQVFGQTVPSTSGVEVLGKLTEDYAVNVFVHERGKGFWLLEELLEFVDHGAGTTFSLGGQEWVRMDDGSMHETEESMRRRLESTGGETEPKARRWKLW